MTNTARLGKIDAVVDDETRADPNFQRLFREAKRTPGRSVPEDGCYWGPTDRQDRPHGRGLTVWHQAQAAYYGEHVHGGRRGAGVDMTPSGFFRGTFAAGSPARGTLMRLRVGQPHRTHWEGTFRLDAHGALEMHGEGRALHVWGKDRAVTMSGVWRDHRFVSGAITLANGAAATSGCLRTGSFAAGRRLVGEASLECSTGCLRGTFADDAPIGTVAVHSTSLPTATSWSVPFSSGLPTSLFSDARALTVDLLLAECVAFWPVVQLRTSAVTLCELGGDQPPLAFSLPPHRGREKDGSDDTRQLVYLRVTAMRLEQFRRQAAQRAGGLSRSYERAVAAIEPLPAWAHRMFGLTCAEALGELDAAEAGRVEAAMRGLPQPRLDGCGLMPASPSSGA